MGWFSSSPVAATPAPSTRPLSLVNSISNSPPTVNQPLEPTNLASSLKATEKGAEKVKPCCVCKDEKSQRDECMLFSRSDDPQEDCKSMVIKYKDCMAVYGFKI
jgi:cytochrome c oxidase assembly protein subunit 17